ncbi:MAG: hypothetical protein ACSLE9_07805 [Burkholderiaceae bacterium]
MIAIRIGVGDAALWPGDLVPPDDKAGARRALQSALTAALAELPGAELEVMPGDWPIRVEADTLQDALAAGKVLTRHWQRWALMYGGELHPARGYTERRAGER